MTLHLRPARPRDATAMGRILSDWAERTAWMPRLHGRDGNRDLAARMISEMLVTVGCRRPLGLPGRALGFLARRGSFVHALYLAPSARRRGLGRALLDQAKAAEGRLTLWCFLANGPARAFYRREGFREVEWGDGSGNDEGLPDVRLEWSAP